MFQPIGRLRKRVLQSIAALASSHFAHPGARTMALLLALGLVFSLTAASCQWPDRTRVVLAPAATTAITGREVSAVWMGAEPTIRVRVFEPSKELVIAGSRLVLIRETSQSIRILRTPLLVTASGGSLVLKEPGGKATTLPGPLELESADPRSPTAASVNTLAHYKDAPTIAVQGVSYPGVIQLAASPRGVQAINVLELEAYVAAVASRELYPSWDLAAYEAQCIAARSYALHSMQLSEQRGKAWHVEDGTIDQAYPGHTTHERSIQAAINTRGKGVAWKGRVLRTYYSSTSGGRSGSAAETWPTGPGFEYNLDQPIQAHNVIHASDASRLHRWQVVRTAEDVTRRLRAWAEQAGHSLKNARAVTNIEVYRTNRVGRPADYRVGERNGVSHVLSAEHLRIALNTSAKGLPDITGEQRINSGDFEVTAGARFIFRGRGFGHGVGMCQFSAQALAQRGWTAQAILQNFYPGATIDRAY